jgi:hypothetical protein
MTGAATGATTVATDTVCDFSSTVRVGFPLFEGNGRPGALFFTGAFLTGAFFAGAFLATFLIAAFFTAAFFTAAFFTGAFFFALEEEAAAFFTTFFADTPRTLCAFSTSTKYATRVHRIFVENALPP